MTSTAPRRRARSKGRIEQLPSGSLRVVVYAGQDPLTKRRHYLREIIPAGPRAAIEADKALRRLAVQVDEQRNPRTTATVEQLLTEHFELLEVEPSTLSTYRTLSRTHIVPLIGKQKVGALRAAVFDSFYAELRRCRAHCDRRPFVEHRTVRPHNCDHRCGPHRCRGLSRSTIRQIHVILSGALKRAVRWRWLSTNPIEHAQAPPQPAAKPQPPSADEAARILNEAWSDPDWAVLVWLTMVTGFRRGELCALRWNDLDVVNGVLTVARSIAQLDGETWEKDTKTHQHRRIALDPDTVMLLAGHRQRYMDLCAGLGFELPADGFMFSRDVDGSTHLKPATVGQRYSRLARRIGIKTTIHKLRHYSATELIAGGVDVRTVAGRLGHGGGGTTTLRVYAAWVSEADQRASAGLLDRLPQRPSSSPGSTNSAERGARSPYELVAAELRAQILDGRLPSGSLLPSNVELARQYGVATGTAHRATALLSEWGIVDVRQGRRAVVLDVVECGEVAQPVTTMSLIRGSGLDRQLTVGEFPAVERFMADMHVRHLGADFARFSAEVDLNSGADLRKLLVAAVRRRGGDPAQIDEYEMDVRLPTDMAAVITFVAFA
ncbi:tyrosine-type recombinase/integrase [Pseudonocardia broussonetiae]|uniref:Tyrosine-type recombinase/integrase n=1 Tax=Pseudonocardia broussonetiae TaxID=2736640 RepID=A0A6M6JAC4_9PSEU|nr:tyrosine-type recombinase/integrase [Pseudonocardia broussonetiae]QJY44814.1 tyrosine-type recombinase/integrase [Pseudonocardia broussonetiae]